MKKKRQRLIDRISSLHEFKGDPTNPEDLLEHFNTTGEIYEAIAISGEKPIWAQEFIESSEHHRIAQYAILAGAAAALITYKNPDSRPNEMSSLELASALRNLLRTEAPTRFKRINTGRGNKLLNSGLKGLLDAAHEELSAASPDVNPGRTKLLARATALRKAPGSAFRDSREPTEHLVKQYLKNKS